MMMKKHTLALLTTSALLMLSVGHAQTTLPAAPRNPPSTSTPAPKPLSQGEDRIALALAKAALAKQGITNPTPAQMTAALNGGTVSTATGPVEMPGILVQRASGKGWGQIANDLGVKLGTLVRSNTAHPEGDDEHASQDKRGDKHAEDGTDKSAQNSHGTIAAANAKSGQSERSGGSEHGSGSGSGSGGGSRNSGGGSSHK